MSSWLSWTLPDFSATKVHFSLVGLASNTEAELWDCVYTLPTPYKPPPTDDSYLNQFMDPNGFLIPSFLDDSALMTLQHPLMTKDLVFFYYRWLSNDVINPSFPLHSLVGILLQGRASLKPPPSAPISFLPLPFPLSFLPFLFYIYQGEFVGSFFNSAWYNPLPSLFNADCPLQVNTWIVPQLATVISWSWLLCPFDVSFFGHFLIFCQNLLFQAHLVFFSFPNLELSIFPDGPGSLYWEWY